MGRILMKHTKEKIRQLIEEIEERKKRITSEDIKKYVKRNASGPSFETGMITDVQKKVNQKFNAKEMLDKIDALLILEKHIEYLDLILAKGFVEKSLLMTQRTYNYFYYSMNSIMVVLLTLLIINIFYLTPHYANSDSEILKTIKNICHTDLNDRLEKINTANISELKITINSHFNEVAKRIPPFSKDFFELKNKKKETLSSNEIRSLIDKHFTNISLSKDGLQLFIYNDQKIRQECINYLMRVYYRKYPKQKYLAINDHIEHLIKQEIIGKEDYKQVKTDVYATIDKYIQTFKDKDITEMTTPYNRIKQKNILNYTLIGFVSGIFSDIKEEERFEQNMINKLINTKNNIINGTKTDIGLTNKLRKFQLHLTLSEM